MNNPLRSQAKKKLLLSIETSCDETAAAVIEFIPSSKKKLPYATTLSAVVHSQIQLHKNMGGVVPEAAARAHVKNLLPVVKQALKNAKVSMADIQYIAPTIGPGLIPSLIVGVEFAKSLALGLQIPIIPVNHMAGHLYSPLLRTAQDTNLYQTNYFPMISLIVSGGHTMLAVMEDLFDYRVIGQTVDDAAGEAFDKVAKLLGLPYPGGPEVAKLAQVKSSHVSPPIVFPRPMLHAKNYDFSFSGLKTAVLYYVQDHPQTLKTKKNKAKICKAFQDAAVDVLVSKTMRAAKQFNAKSVSVSGGVSANTELQTQIRAACKKNGTRCFIRKTVCLPTTPK